MPRLDGLVMPGFCGRCEQKILARHHRLGVAFVVRFEERRRFDGRQRGCGDQRLGFIVQHRELDIVVVEVLVVIPMLVALVGRRRGGAGRAGEPEQEQRCDDTAQ